MMDFFIVVTMLLLVAISIFFFGMASWRYVIEIQASNKAAVEAVAKKYLEEVKAAKGKPVKMPRQEEWPFSPSSRLKRYVFWAFFLLSSAIGLAFGLS